MAVKSSTTSAERVVAVHTGITHDHAYPRIQPYTAVALEAIAGVGLLDSERAEDQNWIHEPTFRDGG